MCAGDVAACGASDCTIKSQSSLKAGWGGGYMAHFYSLANHFENDLILVVHQKGYNV